MSGNPGTDLPGNVWFWPFKKAPYSKFSCSLSSIVKADKNGKHELAFLDYLSSFIVFLKNLKYYVLLCIVIAFLQCFYIIAEAFTSSDAVAEPPNDALVTKESNYLQEFFSPMDVVFLTGESSSILRLHYLPFIMGKRYCAIILFNEQVNKYIFHMFPSWMTWEKLGH